MVFALSDSKEVVTDQSISMGRYKLNVHMQMRMCVNLHVKGKRTVADLRYKEKAIISPSTLIFAPIKS